MRSLGLDKCGREDRGEVAASGRGGADAEPEQLALLSGGHLLGKRSYLATLDLCTDRRRLSPPSRRELSNSQWLVRQWLVV